MEIFWTVSAKSDLDNIFDYIFRENPQAAHKAYEEIQTCIEMLSDFPYAGRPGRIYNTRELILTELTYTVIYRIHQKSVQILRLLHGAQQWP